MGDVEKAVKTANKLTSAGMIKNETLIFVLEGAELKTHLHRCDYDNEQNIRIYEKAIQIIKLLFEDGDYGAMHLKLLVWYTKTATICAKMNDTDAVVENLSAAAKHAISYDLLEEHAQHMSLLFNVTKAEKYGKTYMLNESQRLLDEMATEYFDFCCDNERFLKIINRLMNVACEE